METKPVEKLSKSDEIESANRQTQTNLSSDNRVDHNIPSHKDTTEDNSSTLVAEDAEVWKAYLAVEQRWEEVFRRLADS
ncbi:hypothetical protein [Argonema galeatum]|uniref:hypothetical protein n=1 Tax=Argonema galeatum TaxID=2942762 RepID=UPI0020133DF0|nr:hypothetical protein [Argonema galeatum]MCL1466674.1 hypothetical protein [Argonema galeatum A003/A1]